MWDGRVLRLLPDGSTDVCFQHSGGIQALAVSENKVFICDFQSTLATYQDSRKQGEYRVDRLVRLLKVFASVPVLACEQRLCQVALGDGKVYDRPIPIQIRAAYGDTARPVAISSEGKGFIFDHNLAIQEVFYTKAMSLPLSADHTSSFCVLKHQDNSYSLLHEARVILNHSGNTLAVSETGQHFAVDDAEGIRIVGRDRFLAMAEATRA